MLDQGSRCYVSSAENPTSGQEGQVVGKNKAGGSGIGLPSTGQYHKLWPGLCKTFQKGFLSAWLISLWDSYLEYLHAGVKQYTLNALRMSPVHLNSLFPDQLITKAEEEICRSEERRSSGQSHRHQSPFNPYAPSDKSATHPDRKSGVPTWKQIRDKQQSKKGRGKPSTFSQKPAKGSKPRK